MTTNLAHKKRPPKGFYFPIRTGLRRKVYLHPTNADLYHYAGNCPVRYIDPDGRIDEPLKTPNTLNDIATAAVSVGESALKEAGKTKFTNTKSQSFNDLGMVEDVIVYTPKKIIDPKVESAAKNAKSLRKLGRALTWVGIGIATVDVLVTAYKTKDIKAVGKRIVRNTAVIVGSMTASYGAAALASPVLTPVGEVVVGIAAGTVTGSKIDAYFEKKGW